MNRTPWSYQPCASRLPSTSNQCAEQLTVAGERPVRFASSFSSVVQRSSSSSLIVPSALRSLVIRHVCSEPWPSHVGFAVVLLRDRQHVAEAGLLGAAHPTAVRDVERCPLHVVVQEVERTRSVVARQAAAGVDDARVGAVEQRR